MYRPLHLLVTALAGIFHRTPDAPPQHFAEAPPIFQHGSSKRVKKSLRRYRRWRRVRMQMQRESRRLNRGRA